jgi:hypothetical protein
VTESGARLRLIWSSRPRRDEVGSTKRTVDGPPGHALVLDPHEDPEVNLQRRRALGARPFHNSEIGSARRRSSRGSTSRARLLRYPSEDGELAVRQTTVCTRSALRGSRAVPCGDRHCRRSFSGAVSRGRCTLAL